MKIRKNHGIKYFITGLLLTSLAGSCGPRYHDDDPPPEPSPDVKLDETLNDKELRFRGYVELSSLIETSILTTKGEFSLATYLGSLTELIGFYSPTPANPGWRNVSANTISTATHFLAFDELALDLANECDNPSSSQAHLHERLKPTFQALLVKYCTDPHMTGDEYRQLWAFLTAGAVPASELTNWQAEMQKVEELSVKDRFEFLVTSAMTSPWFIFKN